MHNGSRPADDDKELDEEQRLWSSADLVLSWQVESAVPQLCAEEHQYLFREERHIGAPFLQPAVKKTITQQDLGIKPISQTQAPELNVSAVLQLAAWLVYKLISTLNVFLNIKSNYKVVTN